MLGTQSVDLQQGTPCGDRRQSRQVDFPVGLPLPERQYPQKIPRQGALFSLSRYALGEIEQVGNLTGRALACFLSKAGFDSGLQTWRASRRLEGALL